MSHAVVRARTEMDLDACVDALAGVHASDRYPAQWPSDPGGWLKPSNLVGAWVVVQGADVVGHAGLATLDAATLDPAVVAAAGGAVDQVGAITRLFVTARGRGRGYAAHLLDVARKEAAEAGLPLILDVSDEGRAAIALYERLGWRRVTTSRADWLNSVGEYAVVHYYVSPDMA